MLRRATPRKNEIVLAEDGEIDPSEVVTPLLKDEIKEAVRREQQRKAKVVTDFSSKLHAALGQTLFDKFMFEFHNSPSDRPYAEFTYDNVLYRIYSHYSYNFEIFEVATYLEITLFNYVYRYRGFVTHRESNFDKADELLLWLDEQTGSSESVLTSLWHFLWKRQIIHILLIVVLVVFCLIALKIVI